MPATAAKKTETLAQIMEREHRYLLPTYSRYPIALERGKGVFAFDTEGRKYLDFVGGLGVNALGHAHPRIVKVIREQAPRLIHISNLYYNEYQGLLAERLCKASGMARAFFANSGTEAMEGALKLARARSHANPGKCGMVALECSFHGRTFGALSMTGQKKYREAFEPLLGPVRFVALNDVEGLRAAVDDNTCALVLEPVQGEGGIRACSKEFLQAARSVADQHGATLIFDEIQCGLGRTGALFAFQHFGVSPDVVTIAKPLAAGLPLGAFLASDKLAQVFTPGIHGTTFGGGPLACRVALEYLQIVEDENLLEHVQKVGAFLHSELAELARRSKVAESARGIGMMQALQLNVPGRPIVEAALQHGMLFNSTQDTVLRFLPPFLMTETQIKKGMRVLRRLLREQSK